MLQKGVGWMTNRLILGMPAPASPFLVALWGLVRGTVAPSTIAPAVAPVVPVVPVVPVAPGRPDEEPEAAIAPTAVEPRDAPLVADRHDRSDPETGEFGHRATNSIQPLGHAR